VCKVVAPEFERAADLAPERLPSVAFGAVNVDAYPELAEAMEVTSFPRFFLFRSGKPEAFPVVSTGEAFVAALARMLGVESADSFSPAKEFLDDGKGAEEFAKWLFWRGREGGRLQTTLVLYAPPLAGCSGDASAASISASGEAQEGTCSGGGEAAGAVAQSSASLEAAFNEACGELLKDHTLRFAVVRSASIMSEFDIPTTGPLLVLYKDHDEGRSELPSTPAPTAEGILAWVRVENVPLVTFVNHKTLNRVRKDAATLALVYLEEAQTEHLPTLTAAMQALRGMVYALEKEGVVARGSFTLGLTNGHKYASWMEHYQLPAAVLPAFGAERTASETRYAFEDAAGAWAREALCSAAAAEGVGVKIKWRVILSHSCPLGDREAAISTVRRGLEEAGEAEEAAALTVDINDPKRQFPEPLYVSALSLPLEAIEAWIRKLMAGEIQPIADPGLYASS
jgi:hypothetical protein